jgi:hypothetical protein
MMPARNPVVNEFKEIGREMRGEDKPLLFLIRERFPSSQNNLRISRPCWALKAARVEIYRSGIENEKRGSGEGGATSKESISPDFI